MIDPLAMALEQTDSGIFVPAQARVEVFPWDDLGAVNPPIGYTDIAHQLIGTLAVMIAQGASKPKLVRSTDDGELFTVARTVPQTTITAAVTAPATALTVFDSTPFRPGDLINISPVVSGGAGCAGIQITAIPDMHTIDINAICGGHTFLPGDVIAAVLPTTITNNLSTDVFGPQINVAPGSPNPGDLRIGMTNTIYGHRRMMVDAERSYDWQVFAPTVSNQAVVATIATPGAGFRNILATVIFTTSSNLAGDIDHCEIWQDAAGTGTQLLDAILTPAAANQAGVLPLIGMRIKGNDNKPIVCRMPTVSANVFHSISMFGYIEN